MSHDHSVRHITFSSGRSIEVVRFDGRQEAPADGCLHICQDCNSELVQPVEWHATSDDRWELTLYCPNCDWTCRGIYRQGQLEQLEEQLDLGVEPIMRDLKRLTSANMADEIERFAQALAADLILREDF